MNPEIPGVGSRGDWAIGLSVWTCFERKDRARRLYINGRSAVPGPSILGTRVSGGRKVNR